MSKEPQNRLEHLAALKSKYQATQYEDSLPASLLYLILRKLDLGIELLDLESNWLGESQLEETLEAIRQEQKHKVQEFRNLEFEFSKLKSKYKATNYNVSWQSTHLYFILLKLESGNCARQAIEYQPKSHHPYTLMGAICFERHQYSDGEYWFQEAIKRGANPRDMDSEIKRVVKNAKDENKRREVIEYLLKKDSQRYAWAKSYLKKLSDNGK